MFSLLLGLGLSTSISCLARMPLVKTVTSAGRQKSLLTGTDEALSDYADWIQCEAKTTWLLSRLRSCTIG